MYLIQFVTEINWINVVCLEIRKHYKLCGTMSEHIILEKNELHTKKTVVNRKAAEARTEKRNNHPGQVCKVSSSLHQSCSRCLLPSKPMIYRERQLPERRWKLVDGNGRQLLKSVLLK